MWALNSNRRFSTSSSTFNTNIDTDTNKDTDKKSKNGKNFKDKVKTNSIVNETEKNIIVSENSNQRSENLLISYFYSIYSKYFKKDEIWFKKFSENFNTLVRLIFLTKYDSSVKSTDIYILNTINSIKANLFKQVSYFGLSEKEFNKMIKDMLGNLKEIIDTSDINNKLDNILMNIQSLVEGKISEKGLAVKVLKGFSISVVSIYSTNDEELIRKMERRYAKMLKDIEAVFNTKTKVHGRKKRVKDRSPSDYKSDVSVIIISARYDNQEEMLNWLKNNIQQPYQELEIGLSSMLESIKILYQDNLNRLFKDHPLLDYSRESMKGVVKGKNSKKIGTGRQERKVSGNSGKINISSVKDVHLMLGTIDLYKEDLSKLEGKRLSKLDGMSNTNLYSMLLYIIDNPNLSLEEKQLIIEKTCLEYDMSWFEKELNSMTPTIQTKILHDIYKKTLQELEKITSPFITKRYYLLQRDLNSNSKTKIHDAMAILVILFLGYNNVISISFKAILNILSENKEDQGVSRTVLLMKIGDILNRHSKLKLSKILDESSKKLELVTETENDTQTDTDTETDTDTDTVSDTDTDQMSDERRFKTLKTTDKTSLFPHVHGRTEEEVNKPPKKIKIETKKIKKRNKTELNSKVLNLIQVMYDNMDTEKEILYKASLGDTLLRLLLNDDRVFNTSYKTSQNQTEITINLNSSYIHKLAISSINVTQLPMLVPGNEPEDDGKYYPYISREISHIYNSFDTVIKNKYDNLKTTERQEVLNNTIKTFNKTGFRINANVLNIIWREWEDENSLVFKGLNRLKEINVKDSPEDKEVKISHNSKYWNYFNTIQTALLYVNHVIYLPTFADYRGRVYTLTNYLSYQGSDISRSLLLFNDESKEILDSNGYTYLLVYLANLSGNDKLSWNDKLKWSEENISKIYNLYLNDYKLFTETYLKDLKEPFQFMSNFLAICDVLNNVKKDKEGIHINNPILFDASCNGIQHLSAMTRDIDLAIKTNVIQNIPDNSNNIDDLKPQDFYTYAADLIQKELDDNDKVQESKNLRNIKLNRNLIKKSVMTIPYNISFVGLKEQLIEMLPVVKEFNKTYYIVSKEFTKNNTQIFLYPTELNLLSNIVFDVLTKKLPSLNALKVYLDSILSIVLALDLNVFWITPLGLKINLSTMMFKSVRTKAYLYPTNKPVTISLPTNKLDKQSIKRGFMPNFIHSLDASNVHLLINKYKKGPLYTIHDCFATTPNNMIHLEKIVKESFIEIYFKDGNYLETLHSHLMLQIKSAATDIFKDENNNEYIIVKNKKYMLPTIPESFTSTKWMSNFIEGLKRSRYFIS
jgi:DNA-dependent RNA polymerase